MKKTTMILLCVAPALLAAPPSVGIIEKQVVIPKITQEKEGVNNEIPDFSQKPSNTAPKKESDSKTTESAFVAKIVYEGNKHISKEELEALTQGYLGKSYSLEELKSIVSVATEHYRQKGYFVARAFMPQNAIKSDTLTIAVIEGNYGNFKITNSSLVGDRMVQGMLDEIKEANIISVDTIERAMLLINDTPGASVKKANIMPGTVVGTSDFLIEAQATAPYSAYAIGDNYGSRYTGEYRLNLGINANSPLGYGDKLSLNGVFSTTGDLTNGKASYSFPLMSNGLRGEIGASRTSYSLAKEYEALDALGTSTTLEASLSYPLIRTRQETLNLSVWFAHKNMEDEIQSADTTTKKESNLFTVGANYARNAQFFGLNTNTTLSLNITHGDLSFDDEAAKMQDAAGAKTDGSYSKIWGSIEQSVYFNHEYSLTTNLRFQKALEGKNLDGSEDFSLGGAYGVRAFPDGEHSAENGYILGVELFYALPSYEGLAHKASLFADAGYAKMENEVGADSARYLSDIGIGYQASFKQFFAKVQIATIIGAQKVTSEPERNTKALMQIGWIY